ncbi:hypothetical protein DFH11DRAFT_693389 [Phellopilus nigrolimitatus]|nr:hypothetical protein DFH11DRAFT_693389 [Phellopilus nigrolimitatus]
MAMPATPTKRALTEEAHNSSNASRSPYNGIISDDLTARLQNIGSRVRKRVTEGYATQRLDPFASVPPTPNSSPLKPSTEHRTYKTSPIFRSANDTLLDVFSPPARAAASPPTPVPSPRKRGRSEFDIEDEEEPFRGTDKSENETIAMEIEPTSDDEDITIITNGSPSPSPRRPMRPLKKAGRVHRFPVAPFVLNTRANKQFPSDRSDDIAMHVDIATTPNNEWKDLFIQPF